MIWRQRGSFLFTMGFPRSLFLGLRRWPAAQNREVNAIAHAVRHACAKIGELQLLVLGRGGKEAESLLRDRLASSGVRLRVDGLRSEREISVAWLAVTSCCLCEGRSSSRRGSGLAALACGLPIVAYQGNETACPLTEAGIAFVRQDDLVSLGNQLSALLLDRERRLDFGARNLAVFRQWFAWDRIAERWIDALGTDRVAR